VVDGVERLPASLQLESLGKGEDAAEGHVQFNCPGARTESLPTFPKVPAGLATKAAGFRNCGVVAPQLCMYASDRTWFGRSVMTSEELPLPELSAPEPTLMAMPDVARRIGANCQLPSTLPGMPFPTTGLR